MFHMPRSALGITLAAGCCVALAAQPQEQADAQVSAKAFVSAYMPFVAGGLPRSSKLVPLLAHTTPELGRLLSAAAAAEEAAQCDGPPLIEGDLLSSLAEGPQSFSVQQCTVASSNASCSVRFTYKGPNDPTTLEWFDIIELRRGSIGWRVSDVRRSASWAVKGTLTSRLKSVPKEAAACQK